MSFRAKTTLAVLAAITLAGVGYFFIINKPKPEILPPVNITPKAEEIDTSDWRVYRSEEMGFEMKIPKTFEKRQEEVGPQPNIEDEFWREQVGTVSFYVPKGGPQFRIMVKDANLNLDEFARRVGFGKKENVLINNLPAIRYFLDGRKDKYPSYREALLLKNDNRYYYFEFSASDDDIDGDTDVWNKIISTFKPIP